MPSEKVRALNDMGNIYHDIEVLDKAIEYYNNAINIAKDCGDKYQLAIVLNNLAQAQIDFGRRTNNTKYLFFAQANLLKALEIDKENKDTYNQAVRLSNIGQVYYFISQFQIGTFDSSGVFHNIGFEAAVKYYSLSLEVFKRLGSIDRVLVCLVNLGATHELHSYNKDAQKYYEEAASLASILRSGILPAVQSSINRLKQKI